MYKLIDSASFFKHEEPSVTIMDSADLNSLIKTAADLRISEFTAKIKPTPGKMYLHINAMGAGEYYGSNKNADYFPESNLLQYYKTFETSPAHVFRHHINKDPAKSIGRVIFSIYNERMHRVELIAEVDKSLGADVESRILQGDFPSTSMACKTPYDICSICGNKAHTRQEYCTHLRNDLGKVLPDGRKVMALNVGPLKFFDISIVIKPADVTSSILQKVAYVEPTAGSAELAEIENVGESLSIKQASLKKLSELIKEIEGGYVDKTNTSLDGILSTTHDPSLSTLKLFKHVPLDTILSSLAALGMSPSLEYLAELIASKYLEGDWTGIGKFAKDYLHLVDLNAHVPNLHFNPDAQPDARVMQLLAPDLDRSSLYPEYVEKRASQIGQASFNPFSYEPPVVDQKQEVVETDAFKKSGPILLMVGAAALMAKMYITHLIEKQIRDKIEQNQAYRNPGAKIVIIKSASDLESAALLSRVALKKEAERKEDDEIKESNKVSVVRFLASKSKTPTGDKLNSFLRATALGTKMLN